MLDEDVVVRESINYFNHPMFAPREGIEESAQHGCIGLFGLRLHIRDQLGGIDTSLCTCLEKDSKKVPPMTMRRSPNSRGFAEQCVPQSIQILMKYNCTDRPGPQIPIVGQGEHE